MNSSVIRTISAVIAVIIMYVVFYFFEVQGLQILIGLVVAIGGFELVRLLFKEVISKANRFGFYVCLLSVFAFSSLWPEFAGVTFAFFSILFCLLSLITREKFKDLQDLSNHQAKSILGFFYLGLLPSFVFRLVSLQHGVLWFLTLLAVVFAGDIFAYVVGLNWGRHKLMPNVSPKKTIEGALGGLVGSVCAGLVCGYFFLNCSLIAMTAISISAGVVAQFGDLFESLLKRVADVKDSGRIMPGHGGILDRIDGVLFASPIFLFGAIILEKIL